MKWFLIIILVFGLATAATADIKGHQFRRRPGIKIHDKPPVRSGTIKISHHNHEHRITSSAPSPFPSFPVPADGIFFEARRQKRDSQHIDLVSLIRYLNSRNSERVSNQMTSNSSSAAGVDKIYYPLPKPNIVEMISGKDSEGTDVYRSGYRSRRSVQTERQRGQNHSSPSLPTNSTGWKLVDRSKSGALVRSLFVLDEAENPSTQMKRDIDIIRTQEDIKGTHSLDSKSGKNVPKNYNPHTLAKTKAGKEDPKGLKNGRTKESYEKGGSKQKISAPYLMDTRGQISQADEFSEKVIDIAETAEPPPNQSSESSQVTSHFGDYVPEGYSKDDAGRFFYANVGRSLPNIIKTFSPFDVTDEEDDYESNQPEGNAYILLDVPGTPNPVIVRSSRGYEGLKKLKKQVFQLKDDRETAQSYKEVEVKPESDGGKEMHHDAPCLTCGTDRRNFHASDCGGYPCSGHGISEPEPENPQVDPRKVFDSIMQRSLVKEAAEIAEELQTAEQEMMDMFRLQARSFPTLGGIEETYESVDPRIRYSTYIHFVPFRAAMAPRGNSDEGMVGPRSVRKRFAYAPAFVSVRERWFQEYDEPTPPIIFRLVKSKPVENYHALSPTNNLAYERPSGMNMGRTQKDADQVRQRSKRQVYVNTEDVHYNSSTNLLTILIPMPEMVVTKTELKFDKKSSTESGDDSEEKRNTESAKSGDGSKTKKQRRRILADIIAKFPDAEKLGRALRERIADIHSISDSDIRNAFRGGRRFDGYPTTGFQGEYVFPNTFIV